MHTRAWRYRGAITGFMIALIVGGASVVGGYIYRTADQIREALPGEVLEHQQAVFSAMDDFLQLLHAAEITQLQPSPENVRRTIHYAERTEGRLQSIRQDYNFDFLYGAAAVHALINPALADINRWLRKGVYQYPPDSPVVSEIVYLRLHDTQRQVRALFDETSQMAFRAVTNEAGNLDRFRDSASWFVGLFAMLAVAISIMLILRRNGTAKINRLQRRMVESIESLHEGFALFDQSDRLVVCNKRYRDLFQLSEAQIRDKLSYDDIVQRSLRLGLIQAVDEHNDVAVLGHELNKRHSYTDMPYELTIKGGQVIRVSERFTQEAGIVGIFADITKFKKTQALLERMATHDALTDLATRRLFQDRLEQAISRGRRRQDLLAVMFIDLDHFKQVNDTFGHAVGDDLLRQVADNLCGNFRESDTIARIGGDEFAVILDGLPSRDQVSGFADRALAGLSSAHIGSGVDIVKVSASIGIALFPEDGDTPSGLLSKADIACYQAKSLGRNNFQYYRPGFESVLAFPFKREQQHPSNDG